MFDANTFFRVRKYFCDNLEIDKSFFRPESQLSKLTNGTKWKTITDGLEIELKLKMPTVFTGERIFFFFKAESDTVLDLIDGIIYKNFDNLKNDFGINRDTVFSTIAAITHEILGSPRKDIVPNAKFVGDLGLY